MSVTLFAILVLPRGGFYFNLTGMIACEPFYPRASIRILAACGFYFPTTMILMYCYGSAFHVNKLRLRRAGCNTIASPDDYGGASMEKPNGNYSHLFLVTLLRVRAPVGENFESKQNQKWNESAKCILFGGV
ncbi:unnamed protein product [Brassicogethes aeneus]|uniref:G-protein coupled receptors family 1 profile domain-containing protein n=1 Tax=Brassicogethes aeneus TaxID=1431903 RepID=A0A9P0AZ98_BRAAE|nr:unnamed protein product [Brassicogethes aeneus]